MYTELNCTSKGKLLSLRPADRLIIVGPNFPSFALAFLTLNMLGYLSSTRSHSTELRYLTLVCTVYSTLTAAGAMLCWLGYYRRDLCIYTADRLYGTKTDITALGTSDS